jgi:hypothetical protein
MAEYSFNPQFANLTGLQPVPAIDVTRGANLQFRPLDKIEIMSSQPELIAQSLAGAVTNIAKGALGGITANFEKKEEEKTEKRKFAQELMLEREKRKTGMADFLQKEMMRKSVELGATADAPEIMSEVERRVAASYPDIYDTSEDTRLSPAPAILLEEEAKEVANQVQLPSEVVDFKLTPQEIQPPAIQVSTQTPSAVAVPPPLQPITPVTEKPQATPALEELPPFIPAAKQIQQPPTETAKPWLANQPEDPKQPRETAGIIFDPKDKDLALQAAADLTKSSNNNFLVIAEQNPRNQWVLRQEDKSEDIALKGAQRVAEENKRQVEREKLDLERLEKEKEKLQKDELYLNAQKAKVDDTLNNISLIDEALNLIEQKPEAVGIISKIYQEGKPLPAIGDIAGWSKLGALAGIEMSKMRLQDIEDVQLALESVKANIGWDKLGEMKALSPTGASGVGALSNDERKSLQSTKGSLEQSQSPEILKNNLYRIRNGLIKTTGNAAYRIRQVEQNYIPIGSIPSLELTPSELNQFIKAKSEIERTPESERNTEKYKKSIKLRDEILGKMQRMQEFNNNYLF